MTLCATESHSEDGLICGFPLLHLLTSVPGTTRTSHDVRFCAAVEPKLTLSEQINQADYENTPAGLAKPASDLIRLGTDSKNMGHCEVRQLTLVKKIFALYYKSRFQRASHWCSIYERRRSSASTGQPRCLPKPTR